MDRELEIAKFLRGLILKKYTNNIYVNIKSIYFYFWEIFLCAPDLIIFPSNWPIITDLSKVLVNSDFISLNYEQVLSKFNVDSKRPRGKFLIKSVHHFSWSDDYTSYLINSGVPNTNITNTEKPAYFFLKSLFLRKAIIRKELCVKNSIPKNVKITFLPLTCLQGFKTDARLKKEFRDKKIFSRAVSRRNFVRDSLVKIFDWVSGLANAHPKVFFILRPHPSVSVDQYIEFFKKINLEMPSNVLITSENTSNEWLVISDVVLSNYSSVLLDAKAIGVKAAILQPVKFPNDMKINWFKHFKAIDSYASLNYFLNSSLRSDRNRINFKKIGNGIEQTADKLINVLSIRSVDKAANYFFGKASMQLWVFTLKSLIRFFIIKTLPFIIKKSMRRDYFDKGNI